MALNLQSSVFVKQRIHALPVLSAQLTILVDVFLSLLTTHNGDPDLAFVPFDLAGQAELTVADVPARIYALVVFGTTAGGDLGYITTNLLDGASDAVVGLVLIPDPEQLCEGAVLCPAGVLAVDSSALTVRNEADAAVRVRGFVLLGQA